MLKQGFQIMQESEEVTTLVNLNSGLSIELHTTLYSEESKAYGSYQHFFNDAFEKAQVHDIFVLQPAYAFFDHAFCEAFPAWRCWISSITGYYHVC